MSNDKPATAKLLTREKSAAARKPYHGIYCSVFHALAALQQFLSLTRKGTAPRARVAALAPRPDVS